MNAAERDTSWHFENRQRETKFDEGKVLAFIAVLARDLATGKQFSIVVDSGRRTATSERTVQGCFPPYGRAVLPGRGRWLSGRHHDFRGAGGVAVCSNTGIRWEDEIQALALHGMLHLNGYDHETDAGEMRKLEERLRRKYGLGIRTDCKGKRMIASVASVGTTGRKMTHAGV